MELFSKEPSFPFSDAENTVTLTCCHITNESKPILYVSHDDDDGMWQFLCGKSEHTEEEARLVSLLKIYQLDKSVADIADLPYGHISERINENSNWNV